MTLWSRTRLFFNVKSSAALDRLEDPVEVLDYAFAQQQEQIRALRSGLVEVATARRQLKRQAERLRDRAAQQEQLARQALAADREDLARQALDRKQRTLREIEALERQMEDISRDEERLLAAEQRLATSVEEFRLRRTVTTATYTAAAAQVRVHQELSGLVGEAADISIAVERAEERTERMRARANAVDDLLDLGALSDSRVSDPVERELRDLAHQKAVDRELQALKEENLL